ncbi:DNA-directed RNA polymerase II [Actinoplanes sp. CA-142083]|uniref:DNA-directed RNA polymerase II n=1 Tax=Actinoplanes sp. CA-142083 TaxID=3239903 RepID=UPI003D932810
MPEQPQWYERTLDMPPQDPWADQPTAPAMGAHGGGDTAPEQQPTEQQQSPFTQGRARVNPQAHQRQFAEHEPTGVGWPGADAPHARGMSWRWSDLRRGNEWSTAAALFAFVCWGIWALSGGGSLGTSVIVFVVTLIVAVGVFCLARVVGYYVLERGMGRQRRSARGSHLVTALFLVGVGIADLQQTEWVMTAWNWVAGQVSS